MALKAQLSSSEPISVLFHKAYCANAVHILS